ASPAVAQVVAVVPSANATTEGDTSLSVPLTSTASGALGARFQQVYAAEEFPITGLPVTITGITLRADRGSPAFSVLDSSIRIDLPTTTQAVNALSTTFSTNVGADGKVVYGGPGTPLTLTTTAASSNPGNPAAPDVFDITIPFTTTFSYNPNMGGNLLLDIR